ncbi:hypothetical protein [Alteromonas aestuariivivens]|uniref:hypothetical protein n=1 Tax=Alteromonas aestuariivivens TaxID=1938339 RepID=UPI001FE53F31|nr:hypothetical protein [Alteromonas aestuariivivens]
MQITSFLSQHLQELDFYRFYWTNIQQNLLKQLQERDLSLSMKSQRLWVSLGTQDLTFNRNEQLADCIGKLTFEDIQAFGEQLANRELFGELVLYAPGKFGPMDTPEEHTLSDIAGFKMGTEYFD